MIPNRRRVSCLIAAMLGWAALASAQTDGPDALVGRTRAYVEEYLRQFVDVAAEERSVQRKVYDALTSRFDTRELVADLVVVEVEGERLWLRDVREVDGRPVREDPRDRLVALFLKPQDHVLQQAARIVEEGSRHYLVNQQLSPIAPMTVFQPRYRDRIRFSVGSLDEDLGPNVRVIAFRDSAAPSAAFRGLQRVSGQVWVREATGEVLRAELRVRDVSRIVTDFSFDEGLRVLAPVRMLELSTGESTATYGSFRRIDAEEAEAVEP